MDIQVLTDEFKGLVKSIFCLIIAISLNGCAQEEVFDTLPNQDVYYEAFITSKSGLTIHTSPIISLEEANNNDPIWINNLEILIYEDDEIIDTLQYKANGIYISSPDFEAQSGKEYYFKAFHPTFSTTISNKIIMLSEPDIRNIGLERFRDGYRLTGDIYSGIEDEYYLIDPVFRAEDNAAGFSNSIEHLNLLTDFRIDGGCGWDESVITNFCHKNTIIPLDMYLGPPNFFTTPIKFEVSIASLNFNYFSALRYFEYPTDGEEAFALGINIQQNFFEKGIGVIYIVNSINYEFPI